MSIVIITATRQRRLINGYTLFATGRRRTEEVNGADAAAAWCLQQASLAGSSYTISAPAEVLALIPQDIRSQR